MKKETKVTFQCDCCTEETTVNYALGVGLPEGWLEINVENPHVDRSSFARHFCRTCQILIHRTITENATKGR